MAFSSATHDIAAYGFYMLGLDQHKQAYFVGIRSTFYRIATIVGQGLLVMLAGNLEVLTRNIKYSWSLMFYGMAGLFIAFWLWHQYVLPRPSEDKGIEKMRSQDIMQEFWTTLKTFFQKPQVWVGICFMLFYRMPEGLLAKVSALFLIDAQHNGGLGLSPAEYGLVQGTVGVIGLTLGGILGGILASRDGLKRWLWPMVMAITLPDLVYVYLAYALPNSLMIVNVCIFIEQFGYGFGFSAYMLYLIYYSQGNHKTAHYALCTALMALSMMIPGLFAGALQEAVGYPVFFIIVVVFCAVTYVVTSLLKIDPEFGKKKAS
jgi:PAT family beta-lactamase induction signal transducer AmpG